MIVEVDIGALQGWITIALTIFGGICALTTIGIRLVTRPMVNALKELTTTVKIINETAKSHELRLQDIETIHHMRGCDQPIKE